MTYSNYLRQRAQHCLEQAAVIGADREADHLIALAQDYDLWARHFDEFEPRRKAYPGNFMKGR